MGRFATALTFRQISVAEADALVAARRAERRLIAGELLPFVALGAAIAAACVILYRHKGD